MLSCSQSTHTFYVLKAFFIEEDVTSKLEELQHVFDLELYLYGIGCLLIWKESELIDWL